MKNIIGIIVAYVYVFAIILSAKLIEKKGAEVSRKYIHIMLANIWIIIMIFFDNVYLLSIVPFSFVILNYISYKKNLIKVMERDTNSKDGFGTVYYALSILIICIISYGILKKPIIGLPGIFIMGYGDGFAALIGKSVKSKSYKVGDSSKTLAGSATMLIISFIIFAIFFYGINLWWIKALIASILITIIEAISIKGLDNITVPIISTLIVILTV